MDWTDKRPTEPGLWLCTWHESVTAITVGRDQEGRLWVYRIGEYGALPVETLSRRERYAGPIMPPPLPGSCGRCGRSVKEPGHITGSEGSFICEAPLPSEAQES